jgi:outer membrane lipoprotein-sorting protein
VIKKLLLGLFAATMVAVSASAQTVDELIYKNIKAHGGPEKLKAVKSMRLTGTMQLGPMTAPFTLTKARPQSFRMDFTVQGMTGTQSYDGTTGWMLMPFMGQTTAEKAPDDMLKDFRQNADFDGALVDYKAKGNKVELIGTDSVDGKPAYKLKVTADGAESFLYLDAATYLERRTEAARTVQGQEIQTETNFSDYKDFDGMVFATRIESHAKGAPGGQTITVDKVELNPVLPAGYFAMPAGG